MHWFTALDPQVQAALVGGLLACFAAGATGIFAILKVVVEVRRAAHEVKHQVKNSHSTNLRDDLDLIREDIKEVLRISQANTGAIQFLHDDIKDERTERGRLERRVEHLEHSSS